MSANFVLPLLALTLGHVFSNAVRTLPAVAADVLGRDLALSPQELAGVTAAFPAAFALAMIPVGVALDRWGVKPVALGLLAVAALGGVLAATAADARAMLVAQVVLGLGCSGMMMAPMTFAAKALDPQRFGLWSGLVQAIGNSGMVLTASPLAWLVEAAGWRAGFWACLLLAAAGLLAVSLLVPRDAPAPSGRTAWGDAKEVLRLAADRRLRGLFFLAFVSFGAVLGLRGLWGGPWLMEERGLDRILTGHLLLGLTVALVAGPALAGVVVSRVGRVRGLLVGGHVVAALCLGGLLLRGPVWLDALLLAGFGLSIAFQVLSFALLRGLVRPEESGRALSAMNMFFFGGAAVMQGLTGLAAWAGGGPGAAILCLVLALLAGTWAFARGR